MSLIYITESVNPFMEFYLARVTVELPCIPDGTLLTECLASNKSILGEKCHPEWGELKENGLNHSRVRYIQNLVDTKDEAFKWVNKVRIQTVTEIRTIKAENRKGYKYEKKYAYNLEDL